MEMQQMKAITNSRIVLTDRILTGYVLVYGEKIEGIVPEKLFRSVECDEVLDADGRYTAPGFINIHIHGCGGADTMDDDPQALSVIRQSQVETGVTAFLPTTMTYDFPKIYRSFERIRQAMKADEGAQILGCHMEGPFISEARKGAQAATNIVKADFAKIEAYKDIIRIVTIAPEQLDNYDFVEACQKNHIIVSIGHSSADYSTAVKAITLHGIQHITHLFNGMDPFHHRAPGVVGAALDTTANCEIITDNVHSQPMAQRLVYKCKKPENIILITDSMRACFLGDGVSELGGQKVNVKGQVATLADGTIAGSVLTMDRAVANFRKNTGAALAEVVRMVTVNPAKELRLYDEMGSIEKGKLANFVIFDDDIHIFKTIVKGQTVNGKKQTIEK
jgi:N-acetylglucosamine-6-phosphate deacetylase